MTDLVLRLTANLIRWKSACCLGYNTIGSSLICRNAYSTAALRIMPTKLEKRMPAFNKSIPLYTGLFLNAVLVATSFAQSSNPAWLDDLEIQLKAEQECEVSYFVNMQEGRIGANNYYEARVQCADGRMFDASRTEPEKKFTIKACGAAVC